MVYVFDSNSFSVLGNYYPEGFPSFWENFDLYVSDERIVSVREVYNEIRLLPDLSVWTKKNKHIFLEPTPEEMEFVKEIFKIRHFQNLVEQKKILTGRPVADPFIIASAKIRNACVVTEEKKKHNASKIPNVCEHFGIDCTNLKGFMSRESWTF